MQRALRTDARIGPKIFEERDRSTGDPAAADVRFLAQSECHVGRRVFRDEHSYEAALAEFLADCGCDPEFGGVRERERRAESGQCYGSALERS